jgi:dipeptidyl aminopeptidase/acylaminoacyl peptidase
VDTFVGAVHVTPRGRPHPEGSAEWQLFHDASPISWVSSGDAPTLLIHGDLDPVVPVAQAEAMFKAFQVASVDSDFVRVPNGGHVWASDWAGFPDVISRWLDRHLKIAEQAGK